MNLQDLFEESEEPQNNPEQSLESPGYQTPETDFMGAIKDGMTHAPKLTLKTVNTMKKAIQAKQLEAEKRKELMAVMYAAPPSEEM